MTEPVYILIRTSGRPRFFSSAIASVRAQTYQNVVAIVHTDDPSDDYVEGDIVIRGEQFPPEIGNAPYNLYCNRLLDNIPADQPGWFFFLDDDDVLTAPDVVERAIPQCKPETINVVRVERWDGKIFPKAWGSALSFQTECFILHTDHRGLGRWWANRGGDHHYTRQITDKLKINWIDGIILARAQEGKGHGLRFDLGEMAKQPKPNDLVPVVYVLPVRIPTECRGRPGDIRSIPYRHAIDLQKRGRVTIRDAKDFIEPQRARAHA